MEKDPSQEMEEFAPNPDLPQELIINILLRLPPKSIGQFRCVSKLWRSMLSNPRFIKAHLANHAHDQEKLLFISDSPLFTLTFTPGSSNHATSKRLAFAEHQDQIWFSIVGSCNGLVLVLNVEEIWSSDERTELHSKFLMNPTTMEVVKLPENPLAPDPFNRYDYYNVNGFGYDSCNDDYKILSLSYFAADDEQRLFRDDTYVDVYSVKMGAWRRLENSPYDHSFSEFDSGIFVNGAIHWLAFSRAEQSYVIAAFDLNTEEFREVHPPSTLDRSKLGLHTLVVIGGSLGMKVARYHDGIDVWMMKEYGVGESWSKFSVNGLEPYEMNNPVCQLGNEVVVLEKSSGLVVYNFTQRTLRDLVIADNSFVIHEAAVAFSESLVSPCIYSRNEEQHNPGDDV